MSEQAPIKESMVEPAEPQTFLSKGWLSHLPQKIQGSYAKYTKIWQAAIAIIFILMNSYDQHLACQAENIGVQFIPDIINGMRDALGLDFGCGGSGLTFGGGG